MALSEAIEMAVKLEKDAINFYREALDKTDHPTGVKMFEQFMKIELQHIRMLKNLIKSIDPNAKLVYPDDTSVKTVFSEHKDQMIERVNATTDEMDAVKIALDFEKKGYDFYRKYSEEADSEEEKKLFTILASQEKVHYTYLEKAYEHIKDTGKWFNWEEMGLH